MAVDVPESPRNSGWIACGVLTLVIAGIWLVAAYPAHRMDPEYGLEGLTYAALLTLVPGWVVFVVLDVYRVASSPVVKVGIGTLVRMAVALGGYLAIRGVRPEFGLRNLGLWLLTFYFAALALETRESMRQIAATPTNDPADPQRGNGAATNGTSPS